MIGLDTNVLVRYITQDDEPQATQASALIEALTADEPGFVSLVCVIELYWVLSSCYRLKRAQCAQALELLLLTKELRVECAEQVTKALRTHNSGTSDFADCLIAAACSAADCTRIMTFDVKAAKIAGMTLIS